MIRTKESERTHRMEEKLNGTQRQANCERLILQEMQSNSKRRMLQNLSDLLLLDVASREMWQEKNRRNWLS
jgi:hypothetical protein